MKIDLMDIGGDQPKKISLNIGPSLMVAASEKLRESKKSAFEFAIGQIGKSDVTGERSSPAILTALNEFLGSQILSDAEVAEWVQTWEGRIFTIQHGLKRYSKTEPRDKEGCEQLLDDISQASYQQIVHAVDCLIAGEQQAQIRQTQVSTEISRQQVRLERLRSELEAERYQMEIQIMETASLAKRAGITSTQTEDEEQLQSEAENFTTSDDPNPQS